MQSRWLVLALAACASGDPRDDFVIDTLAEDNYGWALRDPELVAMKLAKMQRNPFEWLRGTAAVFWRDVMTPGVARPATAFGDPASSRVLLVGDPHVENVGSFLTSSGTQIIDWNDFDSAGYGPFGGDVRRLALGVIIATEADDALADDLARAVARGYASQIADLAAGVPVEPIGRGASPYLDDVLDKARNKGDAHEAIDEVAPVVDGVRAIAFGDLDPVAGDGVVEKRLAPVGAEAGAWIDAAIDHWREPGVGAIKLRARRFGSGVSSYAALRYLVVLEGATESPDDDMLVELKEERDGVVISGVPQLAAGEWDSPAVRAVDAQRRLQAVPDADALLGSAEISPLSLKIKDGSSYQRGVNFDEIAALLPDQQRALAELFGEMLARAHGRASTADGVPGFTVIAPRLAGAGASWTGEVAAFAAVDAAQLRADWVRMKDRDLAAEILPRVTP